VSWPVFPASFLYDTEIEPACGVFMKPLLKGYTAEIDTLHGGDWNTLLNTFEDANIYQTWAYNEIRSGAERASTFILKYNGKIVAAAIVRLFLIPLIKAGIAYVYWGPMWRPKGMNTDPVIFNQAIRALRNEYVYKRGLILRIFPLLFNDEDGQYLPHLSNEGYIIDKQSWAGRTLIIDLTGDLATLRKGLEQKWRNCLNRAQRNELISSKVVMMKCMKILLRFTAKCWTGNNSWSQTI
jgi:hypothetical protein